MATGLESGGGQGWRPRCLDYTKDIGLPGSFPRLGGPIRKLEVANYFGPEGVELLVDQGVVDLEKTGEAIEKAEAFLEGEEGRIFKIRICAGSLSFDQLKGVLLGLKEAEINRGSFSTWVAVVHNRKKTWPFRDSYEEPYLEKKRNERGFYLPSKEEALAAEGRLILVVGRDYREGLAKNMSKSDSLADLVEMATDCLSVCQQSKILILEFDPLGVENGSFEEIGGIKEEVVLGTVVDQEKMGIFLKDLGDLSSWQKEEAFRASGGDPMVCVAVAKVLIRNKAEEWTKALKLEVLAEYLFFFNNFPIANGLFDLGSDGKRILKREKARYLAEKLVSLLGEEGDRAGLEELFSIDSLGLFSCQGGFSVPPACFLRDGSFQVLPGLAGLVKYLFN